MQLTQLLILGQRLHALELELSMKKFLGQKLHEDEQGLDEHVFPLKVYPPKQLVHCAG